MRRAGNAPTQRRLSTLELPAETGHWRVQQQFAEVVSLGLEDTRTVGWASYDARGCQCVSRSLVAEEAEDQFWAGLDWSW